MHAPVSVVIPCFRCTSTIDRAVESVFQQTLRPFEVILVEDCSGDETLAKLQELQSRHPDGWIKIIALPQNGGPGTARNKGWDLSTQDYIAFLDSDDSWHHKKIELQYTWMKNNPHAALTGTRIKLTTKPSKEEKYSEINFRQIKKANLLFSNKFPTSSTMIARAVSQRFLENKKYSEDYLLWSEICYSGNQCFSSKEKLTYQYKAGFGASGLTGNMWKLEKGELHTYTILRKKNLISALELILITPFSLLKYLRRVIISRTEQL